MGLCNATRSDTLFHGPQEPSSGHIPFLPSEIIIAILEKACELPLSRKDRQLLVACTLVCKYWLPLARSLLYDSVIVQAGSYYANTQDPGACGSTALLKQPHVLDFTKSLFISVIGKAKVISLLHISKDFTPNGNPKRTRVPDFFALLGHTRQLRRLTLSIGSADKNISPSEPHLLYWLPSLKLPIEVLDIEGGFNSGDFLRSTFACHLVGIWWDTIRALRVFTGRARDDGPLPAERPYIRLRELRFYSTLSAEMLRVNWLLPLPPPDEQSSLRFLTLSKIPEEMHAVLSVHGPSVSSLTLTSQPTFEIAQLFTNLEELVINDPCWKNISGLPRTLKHIRLDVMAWLSDPLLSWSNTLVAAIVKELPTFPNLGLISIEEALTTNKYYPDLQKACEIHKVKILLIPKPNNSSRTLVRGSNLSATPCIHRQLAEASLSRRDGSFSSAIYLLRVLRRRVSMALKDS